MLTRKHQHTNILERLPAESDLFPGDGGRYTSPDFDIPTDELVKVSGTDHFVNKSLDQPVDILKKLISAKDAEIKYLRSAMLG
jgi:hypothetical protein